MPDCAFILIQHHGYEGYGEPQMAFLDEGEARRAQALTGLNQSGRLELWRVPLWPNVAKPEEVEIQT